MNRNLTIIISCLTILGFLLRLTFIFDQTTLSFDESYGVYVAQQTPAQIIEKLKYDFSPPLFYFLLHLWINIFGSSDTTLRIFPLFWGTLIIPTFFYVVLSFSKKINIATLSTLIIAISPFTINYSIEVRMYSLISFIGIINIFIFHRLININFTKSNSIVYILSSILGLATHNSFALIVISQLFYLLILIKHKLLNSIVIYTTIGFLYLPIFFSTTRHQLPQILNFSSSYPKLFPQQNILIYFGNQISNFFTLQQNWIITYFSLFLLIGVLTFYKNNSLKNSFKSFEFYLIFFYLFTSLTMYFQDSNNLTPRYLIVSAHILFILIAYIINQLPTKLVKLSFIITLTIILLQSNLTYYKTRNITLERNYNLISDYISQNEKPNDLIIINPPYLTYPFRRYYPGNTPILPFFPNNSSLTPENLELQTISTSGSQIIDSSNVNQLLHQFKSYDRIWYFYPINHSDPNGEILNLLLIKLPLIDKIEIISKSDSNNIHSYLWLFDNSDEKFLY